MSTAIDVDKLSNAINHLDDLDKDELIDIVKQLLAISNLQNAKLAMQDDAIIRLLSRLDEASALSKVLSSGVCTITLHKPTNLA